MWGAAALPLPPPVPSVRRPPNTRTVKTRPQIAAILTGAESVSVTGFLSAPQTRDLKGRRRRLRPPHRGRAGFARSAVSSRNLERKGGSCRGGKKRRAPFGAPRHSSNSVLLRAEVVVDGSARAVLAPGLAADRALDAVGDRRRCARERQLGGDELRVVVVTQVRHRHAVVARAVAGAGVVCVVGLDRRDCGPDVGLGSRVVRTIAERSEEQTCELQPDSEHVYGNVLDEEDETAFLT